MKTKNKTRKIIRNFTIHPEQGAAALLVGSTAEGLPLKSFIRKDNKVVATYEKF